MLTETLFYGTQLVLNETEVYIAGKKKKNSFLLHVMLIRLTNFKLLTVESFEFLW